MKKERKSIYQCPRQRFLWTPKLMKFKFSKIISITLIQQRQQEQHLYAVSFYNRPQLTRGLDSKHPKLRGKSDSPPQSWSIKAKLISCKTTIMTTKVYGLQHHHLGRLYRKQRPLRKR